MRRAKLSIAQEFISLDAEKKEALTELITEKKVTKSEVRRIIGHIKNGEKDEPIQSPFSRHSLEETRRHSIERIFTRYIASLKFCMMRLDEILDSLDENECVLNEMPMQYRRSIQMQIDSLMRVKSRTQRNLPPM